MTTVGYPVRIKLIKGLRIGFTNYSTASLVLFSLVNRVLKGSTSVFTYSAINLEINLKYQKKIFKYDIFIIVDIHNCIYEMKYCIISILQMIAHIIFIYSSLYSTLHISITTYHDKFLIYKYLKCKQILVYIYILHIY